MQVVDTSPTTFKLFALVFSYAATRNRLIEHAEQLADIDKIKAARAVFSKARKEKKWVTWEVFEAAGAYRFYTIVSLLSRRSACSAPVDASAQAWVPVTWHTRPQLSYASLRQTVLLAHLHWQQAHAQLSSHANHAFFICYTMFGCPCIRGRVRRSTSFPDIPPRHA